MMIFEIFKNVTTYSLNFFGFFLTVLMAHYAGKALLPNFFKRRHMPETISMFASDIIILFTWILLGKYWNII